MINKLDITIWGREFLLPIDYDCDEEEEILDKQIWMLDIFREHPEWLEKAKKQIEEYCKSKLFEDVENEKKDNIFSYIKPDYIYVKRNGDLPRIALMCKYRYDLEHGVAVVFSAHGDVNVGVQDIIL